MVYRYLADMFGGTPSNHAISCKSPRMPGIWL